MTARWLVIFVKEPRPGRVKTRLGRDFGYVAAAWWFRHQTRQLLRRIGRDRRWRTVLAVSPDREGLESRVWPGSFPRIAQGQGSLGDRMSGVLHALPPGPVIIVGADIPEIEPRHIARGFETLGRSDAVLGPSDDGGYWMIGLARGAQALPAHIFKDVRWSTEHALDDTVASLAPLRIGYSSTLHDVDTLDDLRALSDHPPRMPN